MGLHPGKLWPWKGLSGTNTLTYRSHWLVPKKMKRREYGGPSFFVTDEEKKSFITLPPEFRPPRRHPGLVPEVKPVGRRERGEDRQRLVLQAEARR
jgi:hypothetical protein